MFIKQHFKQNLKKKYIGMYYPYIYYFSFDWLFSTENLLNKIQNINYAHEFIVLGKQLVIRAPLITDEEERGIKILTSALEQLKLHKHAAITASNSKI